MKKAATSIHVKIAAVFLLVLSTLTCVFSIVGIIVLMRSNAYSDGGKELMTKTAVELLQEDVQIVVDAAKLSSVSYPDEVYRSTVQSNLDQIFPPEKTNFRYSVYNSAGELLYGNAEVGDDDSVFSFFGTSSEEPAPVTVKKSFASAAEATDFVNSVAANMGAEYQVLNSSLDWQEDGSVAVTIVCSRSTEYRINTVLPSEWAARDKYFYFDYFLSKLVRNRQLLIFVVLGSAVISIALLAYLIIASGRRKGDDKVHTMVFDKIPLEVFTGILVLLAFAPNLWFHLSDWFNVIHVTEYQDRFPLSVIVVVYRIVITLWFVLSIAVRCKNRTLFSNTLIARLLGIFRSTSDLAGRRIPILWRFIAASVILTALEALFIFMPEKKWMIAFWIFEKLAFIVMGLRLILSIDRLERGGKRLNDGDFDTQIDVEGMLPSLRNHAENLNGIREAMRQSLNERMRSERMKAELITNVSHDIKTPLTSVITYVDLLQREGVDCPDAQEYLNVLVRQTGKLKKLVVDLVEASKASTGSIPVEIEAVDVDLLLTQAAGEYSDRMTAKGLETVFDLEQELPMVEADPKLLWRVFDNLLNNAYQYAQPGTRVYLTTASAGETVSVLFRNVSSSKLNISSAELLERFVRGDPSRNTEGSGLGLAIAKDLTELQGGTFKLTIDGDLFKVLLTFPAAPSALSPEEQDAKKVSDEENKD